MMQFYENLHIGDTVAIIFEGQEITLGLKIMEDLLQIMKQNGGSEAPEMQRWLEGVKCQHHTTVCSIN